MNSSSPMSPSTAMIAPVPARDRRSSASAISSATDCRSPREKARMKRDCPSRSEEHTSELQSPCNLVCRLLLEKKKKDTTGADRAVALGDHRPDQGRPRPELTPF